MNERERDLSTDSISKVPELTLLFWIIKILATTLGETGGAAVFTTLLAVVAALYFLTHVSRTALFWAAFILTRPLGAVVGDFLDKPVSAGGMALSRFAASAVLLLLIAVGIFAFRHRPAGRAH